MRARHVSQALEARVAMHVARAAQDLAGRQPRHPPERLVHLRQQPDVRRRVDRLERTTAVPRPPIHHGPGLRLLPDQPADLRRREAARLADVRPHAAPVGAAQPVVVERRQRPPHEGVRGRAILRLVVHRLRSLDEGPNLLHGAQALRLKCHDHPPSVEDSAPRSCSHSVGQFWGFPSILICGTLARSARSMLGRLRKPDNLRGEPQT